MRKVISQLESENTSVGERNFQNNLTILKLILSPAP